jgi:hypothetical protein
MLNNFEECNKVWVTCKFKASIRHGRPAAPLLAFLGCCFMILEEPMSAVLSAQVFLKRVALQQTGHRSRTVFERYNIISNSDLREAAKKLDEASELQCSYNGQL